MKFSDYNLHPQLLKTLQDLQFVEPTPIQNQALPFVLQGKDVAGLAQTGTGKTGAFLIPLVDRVLRSQQIFSESQRLPETERKAPLEVAEDQASAEEVEVAAPPSALEEESKSEDAELSPVEHPIFSHWQPRNYVLILVPTRELAEQVQANAEAFTKGTGLRSIAVYGGTAYDKQKAAFEQGVHFVIATPGRLIDLYKEHICDLKQVRAVVFDEADRMFDMGFKDDMKYILKRIPEDRQFLVFSATLNFDVLNVAYEMGADPVEINVSKDRATAEHVSDEIYHVGQFEKPAYLLSVMKKYKPKQTIIFSNFKKNVERIALFLNRNQIPAVGISSLLTQSQRNRVMEQFKGDSDNNVLVATDVAARGLDILGVDLVINYELPDDPENYVHRIGRTGRAGQEGKACSLVSDRDVEALSRIQDYMNQKINIGWMENDELTTEHAPFPSEQEADPTRSSRSSGGRRDSQRKPRRAGGREGFKEGGRDEGRRDFRGESKGPRDQDPRRGRNNKKRKGPRREGPPAQEASARSTPSSPQQQRETHRDRRLGRHGSPANGAASASASRPTQRSSAPSASRSGGSSRSHRRVNRPSRPSAARAPVAPPSLGQKVSGFFKRLFGG